MASLAAARTTGILARNPTGRLQLLLLLSLLHQSQILQLTQSVPPELLTTPEVPALLASLGAAVPITVLVLSDFGGETAQLARVSLVSAPTASRVAQRCATHAHRGFLD